MKYGHTKPTYLQLTPYKHRGIKYGSTQQLIPAKDTRPDIDASGVNTIQSIIGALLYYAQAVNNKLLVALSSIGSHQASVTEDNANSIKQLLD